MTDSSSPPPQTESTLGLLHRARGGDERALERLLARYLSSLRRWASGRLPCWARELLDTDDLVQETLMRTLRHLDTFEPRHEGAFHAYLRRAVLNRIQDEIRRVRRRPAQQPIDSGQIDHGPSPLEEAVGQETLSRYEEALARLRVEDREAIIARVEMGLSWQQVAEALEKASVEAAQMAVSRALVRLAQEMGHER